MDVKTPWNAGFFYRRNPNMVVGNNSFHSIYNFSSIDVSFKTICFKNVNANGCMKYIFLFVRYLSTAIVAIVSTWLLGFGLFALTLPNSPKDTHHVTDAIVVLTGGKGRVEFGFSLFNAGLGKRLFISGVYPGVKAKTLVIKQNIPLHLTQRLSEAELEYISQNTAENAIETAKWVNTHSIQSIRLVTGNYHMQRSLIEFKKLLPNVSVIANPIPEQQRSFLKRTRILWNEYIKLTFIWLKDSAHLDLK
jgi:uncharacterized SAM-binding protein YcdF (DUF218 family)